MKLKKYTAELVQENGEVFYMEVEGVSSIDASFYIHKRMLTNHMNPCCRLLSITITDEDYKEYPINVKWWYEEWSTKNN